MMSVCVVFRFTIFCFVRLPSTRWVCVRVYGGRSAQENIEARIRYCMMMTMTSTYATTTTITRELYCLCQRNSAQMLLSHSSSKQELVSVGGATCRVPCVGFVERCAVVASTSVWVMCVCYYRSFHVVNVTAVQYWALAILEWYKYGLRTSNRPVFISIKILEINFFFVSFEDFFLTLKFVISLKFASRPITCALSKYIHLDIQSVDETRNAKLQCRRSSTSFCCFVDQTIPAVSTAYSRRRRLPQAVCSSICINELRRWLTLTAVAVNRNSNFILLFLISFVRAKHSTVLQSKRNSRVCIFCYKNKSCCCRSTQKGKP